MFSAFSLIPGPLSPVYRWYLSGLIQLPMNIGMCLHPIDPAIKGGDHRLAKHKLNMTYLPPLHVHTQKPNCNSTFIQKRKLKSDFKINASRKLEQRLEMKAKIPVEKHTNRPNKHASTLLWGRLLDPYCPLAYLASLRFSRSTDA